MIRGTTVIWALLTGGLNHHLIKLPVGALVRPWCIPGPGLGHHLQTFLEARICFLDRDAKPIEFLETVALADSGIDSALR